VGTVVGRGLVGAHAFVGDPVVKPRPHAPGHGDGDRSLLRASRDLTGERDRGRVESVKIVRGVAEEAAPIRVGAPGRRVEHQRPTGVCGERDERTVVGAQRLPTPGGFEEHEGGELGEFLPEAVGQRGLDAAVRQCERFGVHRSPF